MMDLWELRGQYIAKKNPLIRQVRFNLTTVEQKIVLYLISKIKPTDTELEPITISIGEFLKLCGLDHTQGNNRTTIKNTLKRLADKSCWIRLPNGAETLFRWIEDPIIEPRAKDITLKLKQILKPYLLELHDYYTQYQLMYILPMNSEYAIRLYELFKSCETLQEVTFRIDKIRELLNLSAGKFKEYADFRRFVIDLSIKEINQYTDLIIEYQPNKKGRKVDSLTFTIKKKEDLSTTFDTLREKLDKTIARDTDR